MKHRVPPEWRKVQILTIAPLPMQRALEPEEEEDTQPILRGREPVSGLCETAVKPPPTVPTITVRIRRD
jgi:hypothetical protein